MRGRPPRLDESGQAREKETFAPRGERRVRLSRAFILGRATGGKSLVRIAPPPPAPLAGGDRSRKHGFPPISHFFPEAAIELTPDVRRPGDVGTAGAGGETSTKGGSLERGGGWMLLGGAGISRVGPSGGMRAITFFLQAGGEKGEKFSRSVSESGKSRRGGHDYWGLGDRSHLFPGVKDRRVVAGVGGVGDVRRESAVAQPFPLSSHEAQTRALFWGSGLVT